MKEIYQLNNGNIDIPVIQFIKEKNKYITSKNKKKRYLFNNVEYIISKNGSYECYKKELLNHSITNNTLEIDWNLKEHKPENVDWTETEEYISEEYTTEDFIIEFITTIKGFRRILKKIYKININGR